MSDGQREMREFAERVDNVLTTLLYYHREAVGLAGVGGRVAALVEEARRWRERLAGHHCTKINELSDHALQEVERMRRET